MYKMVAEKIFQLFKTSMFLIGLFYVHYCHSSDDIKIQLRRFGTNLCMKVETVSLELSRVQTVVLQPCEWHGTRSMTFSIHALEPIEPIENEDDIARIVQEYLIRISGSSCVITGSDNYSVKTGKCSVLSGRYAIENVLVEKRDSNGRIYHPQLANSDTIHDPMETITNVYAFYFRQGSDCLTDRHTHDHSTTPATPIARVTSIILAPCVKNNPSQMWSICSTDGECSEVTRYFFNLPLHYRPYEPSTTEPPVPTTTSKKRFTRRTTTVTSTSTGIPSTVSTVASVVSTSTTTERIKNVEILALTPPSCHNSSLRYENSSCVAIASSSSHQQFPSLAAVTYFTCISIISIILI